jgi:hypothetical protein
MVNRSQASPNIFQMHKVFFIAQPRKVGGKRLRIIAD